VNAAKLSLWALALLAVGHLAACASDTPAEVTSDDGGADVTAAVDSGPVDSGAKDSAPAIKVCVSKCATDNDCQTSCPNVDGGINCCDTATGVCFASQTATCPAPKPDSGGSSSGYP
jgi:hypothetical protein